MCRYLANHIDTSKTTTNGGVGYNCYFDETTRHSIFHTNLRTDAVVLEAFLSANPTHEIVPKLVTGILDRRENGRWSNTQENYWCSQALNTYFKLNESKPNFVSRIWFKDSYCGELKFQGNASSEFKKIEIPFSYFGTNEKIDSEQMIMQKEGVGTFSYRVAFNYCPVDQKIDFKNEGFSISRNYFSYDKVKPDEKGSPLTKTDELYRVKKGTLLRVEIVVRSEFVRYYVALDEKMAAGLEADNSLFLKPPTTEKKLETKKDPNAEPDYNAKSWYDHVNMRNERVEVFADITNKEKDLVYSYVVRATNVGQYYIPPANVFQMYNYSIRGNTSSERIEITE